MCNRIACVHKWREEIEKNILAKWTKQSDGVWESMSLNSIDLYVNLLLLLLLFTMVQLASTPNTWKSVHRSCTFNDSILQSPYFACFFSYILIIYNNRTTVHMRAYCRSRFSQNSSEFFFFLFFLTVSPSSSIWSRYFKFLQQRKKRKENDDGTLIIVNI